MTEKRFKEIISTQKVIDTVTNKEYDCLLDNDLFDLINTIAEENEQLKHDATVLIYSNQEYRKENEQLKQDKTNLHRTMSKDGVRYLQFRDKVFDLIDDKIKEAKEGFQQTYDSWYQGQIDGLKELKKGLKE